MSNETFVSNFLWILISTKKKTFVSDICSSNLFISTWIMAQLCQTILVAVVALTSVKINKASDEPAKAMRESKESTKATKTYYVTYFNITKSTLLQAGNKSEPQNLSYASWKVKCIVLSLTSYLSNPATRKHTNRLIKIKRRRKRKPNKTFWLTKRKSRISTNKLTNHTNLDTTNIRIKAFCKTKNITPD